MARTVLIVDDEVDLVEAMRFRFEQEGWTTLAAHRGCDALETLTAHEPPALVVLDYQLPDMTGSEVCSRLRAERDLAAVPIVLLTARGDLDLETEARRAGFDDVLLKPATVAELIARADGVSRATSRSRLFADL